MDKQLEPNQCVRIIWLDSTLKSGWVYDDEAPHPKVIESIGFICGVAEDCIQITTSRSGSGGVIAPLTIPLGCIQTYHTVDIREVPPHF